MRKNYELKKMHKTGEFVYKVPFILEKNNDKKNVI